MEQHSIGKTIAKLRKEKNWTQLELSEKLNVSDKTISKWESETGLPEITQFPVLASIFDVSIDYLMTGKKEEKIKVISKLEEIIKKDDVESFSKISDETLSSIDADGKYIFDCLYDYYAPNIALEYEKKKLSFDNAKFNQEQQIHQFCIKWFYGIKLKDITRFDEIKVEHKDNILASILSKYSLMTLKTKEKVLSHVDISFIEYALKNSKHKDEIVELFIKNNPTIKENEVFSFLVENGYTDMIVKYHNLLEFDIKTIAKYQNKFDYSLLISLCIDDEKRANTETLSIFNNYQLTKKVFEKYDVVLEKDIIIWQDFAYIKPDTHLPYSGFHNDYCYFYNVPGINENKQRQMYYNASFIDISKNYKGLYKIKTVLNLCYKNGFLADQFVHQNREKLDRKLKMCYITDLYNRNLFEDCADLMGKKLYEFFTVACRLKGSFKKMAECYNTNFEPGYFTSNEDDCKKFYEIYKTEGYTNYVKISDLINHIVDIYNKVKKNKFDQKIDKIYKTELQLLGKLYDEEVIFPVDHSNDWD